MEIEKSAERKKVTINTLLRMKAEHKKAAYVTAYDFPSARRADRAGMDIVLVGDSMGMTVYGFDNINLDNVVFKKYRIINKSPHTIDSMYFTYFSDPDLGDAVDDYVGCDTALNLAYCYNGDNYDGDGTRYTYGTPPPAVGYLLVQGPIKKGSDSLSQLPIK